MRRWFNSLSSAGVYWVAVLPIIAVFLLGLFVMDRFGVVANEHVSVKNGCVVVRTESPIGRTLNVERKC